MRRVDMMLLRLMKNCVRKRLFQRRAVKPRKGISAALCRHGFSLPSAVSRTRSHDAQNFSESGVISPTVPR